MLLRKWKNCRIVIKNIEDWNYVQIYIYIIAERIPFLKNKIFTNNISLIKINIFMKYKIYIYYPYIFTKHKIFYSSENISLNGLYFESNIYK